MSTIITAEMSEPEDDDTFFIDVDDGGYGIIAINVEGSWMTPGSSETFDWEQIRKIYDGWSLQSLADHDAQIRAGALKLSKSDRMAAYDVFDDKVVLPTDVDYEDAEPCSIDTIIRRIFATVANHRKGQKQ